MGEEAEAPGLGDGRDDLGGFQAAVVDLLVDPEGEVVVALPRGDLLADAHQHAPVVALATPPAGLERVVISQQYDIDTGAGRLRGDLLDGAGPVGVHRMGVDHACDVDGRHAREP